MFAACAGYDREEAVQMFHIVDADHGEMWHLFAATLLLSHMLQGIWMDNHVYVHACMLACNNVYQSTGGSVSLEEFIDWFLHNQTGKDKRRLGDI